MQLVHQIFDFLRHMDTHLDKLIVQYGTFTNIILFFIIFAETGFVITPFLPGDSLLFAAGALSARNSALNPVALFLMLACAALLGDNVNYCIGKFLGPRLFKDGSNRLLKREHLERTHRFYEKYGGKAIILARFVPIVRTFSPFVAGLGTMRYRDFIGYSVAGAALWVGVCVFAGYFFGNIPAIKSHFELAVLAIILISLLPILIELIKHRLEKSGPKA